MRLTRLNGKKQQAPVKNMHLPEDVTVTMRDWSETRFKVWDYEISLTETQH